MTRVLLLGGDGDLEHLLGKLPSSLFVPVSKDLVEKPTFDINDLMVKGYLPDVVVLGPDLARDSALRIARGIDVSRPEINVVLVAKANEHELLEAMRAGVRDIISPDATQEELMSMLVFSEGAGSRLSTPVVNELGVPIEEEHGRIIVIVSPKGGVGKSTVTSNLTAGLAMQYPKQVVVIDLDLQFGDVATHLDLHPQHSLSDVFATAGGVDVMLLKTFLTSHPLGFFALCAPSNPADADRIGTNEVKALLAHAAEFKFVIVDTGAGLDEPTLAALEQASDAVIVSSMDVSSVRNVRKEIEVLSQLEILPQNRHMVLNFVDRKSGMSVRDVEAVLGIPVNIAVPRADDVVLATNRGVPVILQKRSGDVGKAVKALVERLIEAGAPTKQKVLHKGSEAS